MGTYLAASSTRLFLAVALFAVLFGATLGATLLIGVRVLPAGANHTGNGLIHVCVNNSTGAMREVPRPNQCRSYEHAVELGGPGISGYEVVTGTRNIGPGDTATGSATCPTGKRVIGGGFDSSNAAPLAVEILNPTPPPITCFPNGQGVAAKEVPLPANRSRRSLFVPLYQCLVAPALVRTAFYPDSTGGVVHAGMYRAVLGRCCTSREHPEPHNQHRT